MGFVTQQKPINARGDAMSQNVRSRIYGVGNFKTIRRIECREINTFFKPQQKLLGNQFFRYFIRRIVFFNIQQFPEIGQRNDLYAGLLA